MISKRKSAFTLIELLVVIGIIMILASILTPGLMKARKKANQVACLANVKAIGSAMMLYADDNNNQFPYDDKSNDSKVAFGFMYNIEDFTEMGVFKCPQSRTTAPTKPAGNGLALVCTARQGIDYGIVSAQGATDGIGGPTSSDPSSNVLLVEDYRDGNGAPAGTDWDQGDNHTNGGNCYFINGSAKFIKSTADIPNNFYDSSGIYYVQDTDITQWDT